MNELLKAKIEPKPGGSVQAPDPSELIDLEVFNTVCFIMLYLYVYSPAWSF